MLQSLTEVLPGSLFDALANEKIAHVRVTPAMTGFEVEAIDRHSVQHLLFRPRPLFASYSFVIGRETSVVWDASTVLEQMA
jgi:hypothetical protein